MNIDGSSQTQLTDFKGAEAFMPSWSPDGQRIVFSKCPEPLGFPAFCDIAVMNADGTGVKKLVGGRRYNIAPAVLAGWNRDRLPERSRRA